MNTWLDRHLAAQAANEKFLWEIPLERRGQYLMDQMTWREWDLKYNGEFKAIVETLKGYRIQAVPAGVLIQLPKLRL